MAFIAYPVDLPGPEPGSFAPRDRRAVSTLEGSVQQRARQRDVAGARHQCVWTYTPDEMEIWLAWYRNDLADGRYWFAAFLPGYGGLQRPKHVRYLTAQQALLGSGLYRVTATLEVRAYLPPTVCYFSAVYPLVVDEAVGLGSTLVSNGRLTGVPILDSAMDFGALIPLEGGQLRSTSLAYETSESIDAGLLVIGEGGGLIAPVHVYTSTPDEVFFGLSVPQAGVLKNTLITQDQLTPEAVNLGLTVPGNGALS